MLSAALLAKLRERYGPAALEEMLQEPGRTLGGHVCGFRIGEARRP